MNPNDHGHHLTGAQPEGDVLASRSGVDMFLDDRKKCRLKTQIKQSKRPQPIHVTMVL